MVLSTKQWVSIIIIIGLLVGGVMGGAYVYVQGHSSVPCLGCLGLSPLSGDFEDWWTEYPNDHAKAGQSVGHPSWILDALKEKDMVLLFFWQVGCGPCVLQWEDMVDEDLVSGTEEDGKLVKYTEIVNFYSLDINEKDIYKSALHTYDPQGSSYGTPTTTFLVTLHDDEIGWYSYKGQMDADTVENILTIGLNIH